MNKPFWIYVAVMALVTYLLRALPLLALQKKIKNQWFQSFLYYVPYAVLSAMTFPAILSSTQSIMSAIGGLIAALVMGYMGKSLLSVALVACLVVYVIELVI